MPECVYTNKNMTMENNVNGVKPMPMVNIKGMKEDG